MPEQQFYINLLAIGATPVLHKGRIVKDHLLVPCKCILKDGTTLDYCIIQLVKDLHHINDNINPLFTPEQIADIFHSAFSLSLEIRKAAINVLYNAATGEYDWLTIGSADGKYFFIEPDCLLFKNNTLSGSLKGRDMQLISHLTKKINPRLYKKQYRENHIFIVCTSELLQTFIF